MILYNNLRQPKTTSDRFSSPTRLAKGKFAHGERR